MKKFAFNLQPLFEHRQDLLDLKQAELGSAMDRLAAEVERLEALTEAYRRTGAELDEIKRKGAQSPELNLYSAYLASVRLRLEDQEALISEIREDCEARRKSLVEASRDRKVVEMVKKRSYEGHLKEADRSEQKDHDELASRRTKGWGR
ncbi:MAG: flagellar export protein FliJ [Thermodesulfobacteriota bacterium]